jgi:hypothetical protein
MNTKLGNSLKMVTPVLALMALLPAAALADLPGRHPGYLHALSDLRMARALIMRPDAPNVEGNEYNAMREIDACCNDLIRASINDGKNVNDHPPVDVGMDFKGRLGRAMDLLRSARNDMDHEEDDPFNRGLQFRANQHVDRAMSFVKRAIDNKIANRY